MSDDLVKRLRSSLSMLAQEEAADRIEELEAKLAKAVEALEEVRIFVRDLEPYADQGHTLVPALYNACITLAELKGETNV